MIKINLLARPQVRGSQISNLDPLMNSEAADEKSIADQTRNQFLGRLLIFLLVPTAIYLYESNNLTALESQEASLQPVLVDLQNYNQRAANSKAEVDKFKEDEARIQARINALNQLSAERLNEIKILDLVQQVIPEKIWLTQINFKTGRVSLGGFGSTDDDVSKFQEVLTKSAYLKNVTLASSKEAMIEKVPLRKFEIRCQMEKIE